MEASIPSKYVDEPMKYESISPAISLFPKEVDGVPPPKHLSSCSVGNVDCLIGVCFSIIILQKQYYILEDSIF